MQWIKATEQKPEEDNEKQIFVRWKYDERHKKWHYGVAQFVGRFIERGSGSLCIGEDIIEWLDESPPASAVEEADKLYPPDPENDDWYTDGQVSAMQQRAHITCAGMYTGEIEKGREAIDILKALCALKKHKDTVGKDEYYEKAQPEIWKIAKKFLDSIDKK